MGLPTTASLGGRPGLNPGAGGAGGAALTPAFFLGRPLGLGETTPGGAGAAKGMTVGCDWILGGRPGRRLRPLDTDLGLGGRPGLFGNLDLAVPGGRPRPLLAGGTAGPTAGAGGGGSSERPRETKTGWAFWMGLGLGLGGRPRPRPLWGVGSSDPAAGREGGGGRVEGSL